MYSDSKGEVNKVRLWQAVVAFPFDFYCVPSRAADSTAHFGQDMETFILNTDRKAAFTYPALRFSCLAEFGRQAGTARARASTAIMHTGAHVCDTSPSRSMALPHSPSHHIICVAISLLTYVSSFVVMYCSASCRLSYFNLGLWIVTHRPFTGGAATCQLRLSHALVPSSLPAPVARLPYIFIPSRRQ